MATSFGEIRVDESQVDYVASSVSGQSGSIVSKEQSLTSFVCTEVEFYGYTSDPNVPVFFVVVEGKAIKAIEA